MKRFAALLLLLPSFIVCTRNEPLGPSMDAPDAVASARRPGPPPGTKPGPPAGAGQPAELTIVKTASSPDATVEVGDPIAFDIRVTNNGPGTALDVHLTDNLPILGSTWTIIESAGVPASCQFIASTLFCGSHPASPDDPAAPPIDLAPGEFFSMRVSSPTDVSDCGTVTNTANASADNAPAVSSSASIAIVCPELTIVKTAVPSDAPVQAGDPIGFEIRVANSGLVTALDVRLTDNLPHLGSNWSLVELAGKEVGCKFIADYSLRCGRQLATPDDPGIPPTDLEPGEFFSVRVSSPTDASECGTVTNTASAGAVNATGVSDSASAVIVCPPSE